MELLFLGIEMVKLQSGRMLIKSAKAASTTCLFDQLTLDLAPPPRHGRRIAPRTAIATLPSGVNTAWPCLGHTMYVCFSPISRADSGFSAPGSLRCL
jgi:hypothetical protein